MVIMALSIEIVFLSNDNQSVRLNWTVKTNRLFG